MREIEKAFDVIELLKMLKVKCKSYMQIGDEEAWWSTLSEICYGNEQHMWEDFEDNSCIIIFPLWSEKGRRESS